MESAKMIRDYEVTTRIEPGQSKTTRSRVRQSPELWYSCCLQGRSNGLDNEAGIEPMVKQYRGKDPRAFVIRTNQLNDARQKTARSTPAGSFVHSASKSSQ
jgi:hypothetical protein